MSKCIICKGNIKILQNKSLKCTVPMGTKIFFVSLGICKECGHVQKIIDSSWKKGIKNLYEKKYFFLGKHINFKNNKVISRDDFIVKKIKKKLQLENSGNFLDIGCGAGNFLHSFAKFNKGWLVNAQDISSINKKLVLKKKLIKKFYQCDITKIKEKFDLISANHVLEHVTNPINFLNNIHKILNEDGCVIIRVPNYQFVNSDFSILDHCSHFSKQSIKNMICFSKFRYFKFEKSANDAELFIILKKVKNKSFIYSGKKIVKNYKETLNLVNHLIKKNLKFEKKIVQENRKHFGIFGVGTSSFYLNALFKNRVKFFVDEDTSKINKFFDDKKIYSIKNFPKETKLFIYINNSKVSNSIKKRIYRLNTKRRIVLESFK